MRLDQSGWLDLNQTISCSRSTRNTRLSHVLKSQSAQRESNPHIRHGKAVGCRYIMGAWLEAEIVKDQEHREGLEPTSPHYGCGVFAARRPVLVFQWDRWDRTHIIRLRDRGCAAVYHSPVVQSARWELNPRPASYKDAALTVELRASESRVGGNRTHTVRIKSPLCCQLHHDPMSWSGVCVSIGEPGNIMLSPFV